MVKGIIMPRRVALPSLQNTGRFFTSSSCHGSGCSRSWWSLLISWIASRSAAISFSARFVRTWITTSGTGKKPVPGRRVTHICTPALAAIGPGPTSPTMVN